MMKKTLIFVFSLIICIATMLTLTACHECEWSQEWFADLNKHYHKCTVEGCDLISDEAQHVKKSEFVIDTDVHYYECTTEGCPARIEEAQHVYDQKVETETYLDQEATATTNATYFFSCVCGKEGTTTFEKEKAVATAVIDESYLGNFSRTYDNDYTYCSKYWIDTVSDGNMSVYYKSKGADDSTYQLQGDGVAEDAGEYVMKVVIAETEEYQEIVIYHDFEITKVKGSFDYTKVWKEYNGNTNYQFLLTHYWHNWVVDGYSFNVKLTTSAKTPGVYSTQNGTLTVEPTNPNYEITSASFEIRTYEIYSRTIDVEYEEDGIYEVKLDSSHGIKVDDEVFIKIDARTANTVGKHDVYRAPTNVKGAVWMLPPLTGADANCYLVDDKLGWEGQLWISLNIVEASAE